ncbi:hypothetical protein WG66_016313 [Moniliophthora roreri]|nr:hypothetical protein WG66_016313 [Moniliophthora roreri]
MVVIEKDQLSGPVVTGKKMPAVTSDWKLQVSPVKGKHEAEMGMGLSHSNLNRFSYDYDLQL